jgi:peptidoglycan-associated lipoprotein
MSRTTLCKIMIFTLCLTAFVGAEGCKRKKQPAIDTTSTAGPTTVPGAGDGSSDGLPQVDQGSLLFDPNSPNSLRPVYFDYDSSALRPDQLTTLSENAAKIKAAPGTYVQIAGHCDERGTQEYNLALGERRALAVRSQLTQLGVDGNYLLTISYGEEMPAVSGSDESAFSQNRRAEFRPGTPVGR